MSGRPPARSVAGIIDYVSPWGEHVLICGDVMRRESRSGHVTMLRFNESSREGSTRVGLFLPMNARMIP